MRYIICLLSICFAASFASAQNPTYSKFYDKYADDPDFTIISISPKLFGLFSEIDIEDMDEDLEDVVKGLQGLKILINDKTDGKYLYKEASSSLISADYDELISIRTSDGENVRMYSKDEGNIVQDLLVIVNSDDTFVFMDLWGQIDLRKVGKLSETLDVPGAEHLKELKRNE